MPAHTEYRVQPSRANGDTGRTDRRGESTATSRPVRSPQGELARFEPASPTRWRASLTQLEPLKSREGGTRGGAPPTDLCRRRPPSLRTTCRLRSHASTPPVTHDRSRRPSSIAPAGHRSNAQQAPPVPTIGTDEAIAGPCLRDSPPGSTSARQLLMRSCWRRPARSRPRVTGPDAFILGEGRRGTVRLPLCPILFRLSRSVVASSAPAPREGEGTRGPSSSPPAPRSPPPHGFPSRPAPRPGKFAARAGERLHAYGTISPCPRQIIFGNFSLSPA